MPSTVLTRRFVKRGKPCAIILSRVSSTWGRFVIVKQRRLGTTSFWEAIAPKFRDNNSCDKRLQWEQSISRLLRFVKCLRISAFMGMRKAGIDRALNICASIIGNMIYIYVKCTYLTQTKPPMAFRSLKNAVTRVKYCNRPLASCWVLKPSILQNCRKTRYRRSLETTVKGLTYRKKTARRGSLPKRAAANTLSE